MKGETELIKDLEKLRNVKPSKDWVILTKKDILGESEAPSFSFSGGFSSLFLRYKSATLMLVVVGLLLGTFGFAQTALPGDTLYVLKKATERTKIAFVSKDERANVQLSYANENLENLVMIAQNNQVNRIAPIINEYQNNLTQATESLSDIEKTDIDRVKDIVERTKEIEKNREKLEVLGVIPGGEEEIDQMISKISEDEKNAKKFIELSVEEMENRILSEEEGKNLEKIKEYYQEGRYDQALRLLIYPQEK